ncbi:MAG TPA: VTT domain-containing protein [Steroidobacteraceae bacterium]|jgi:membrane protein DedA with SNARE-associated domain/rhodanese-related sulfurtransferase|nr:VTT domain-containing protein [Steroidobacteraceae bacterium]
MGSLNTALSQHGYAILAAIVFLEAIGIPVPAAIALLVSGGAVARGVLQFQYVLGIAVFAMLAGDTLMFLLGRYTGWWLLGILCRVSLNPETCILRSADSFYRRGRTLLVIAKFIPGINTMAPPLAGSMRMRLGTFLRLDLAGAALYAGSYFAVGYVFSGALDIVMRGYDSAGKIVGWIVIALLIAYLLFRVWLWVKGRAMTAVPFASPEDAARELRQGALVFDVRSHGYFDPKAMRIQGSRRLDPNALHQPEAQLPGDGQMFVYCTCVRQATSVRVAQELLKVVDVSKVRVSVIQGGLRAWVRAGLPVEEVPAAEVAALPAFE